jgi:hypothetical protein
MPIELQIIRACEFIRVGAQGRLDLAASKAALSTLARACRKRDIHQALLDLREIRPGATPAFTPSDLVELIGTFRGMGFTKQHRLAVLYSSDPHRRARLFAALGTLQGWHVGAFENFEAALFWLAGEENVDLASHAAESPIPMKRVRTRRLTTQKPTPRPEMN